jgi:hypothetical protein
VPTLPQLRAVVTTVLDVVALIAVPFGAGMVAGVGVGVIVGGLCCALASRGIVRGGDSSTGAAE